MQTQYLPQMLSYMVQSLLENMDTLSLPELTHALKTCFKVLSKVQMPPSYLDMETGSGNTVGIAARSVACLHMNGSSQIVKRVSIIKVISATIFSIQTPLLTAPIDTLLYLLHHSSFYRLQTFCVMILVFYRSSSPTLLDLFMPA